MRNMGITEKNFWRFWLGGLLLFAVMIALNPWLSNDVASGGIGSHQSATSAVKIDAIQQQWRADGLLWLARLSMAIDLFFIGIYGFGAWLGGRLFCAESAPLLRRLGVAASIAAPLFVFTDYAETIAQFIQIMQFKGSDSLTWIASHARPLKMLSFLVSFAALLAAILVRRITYRNA